MKQMFLYTVTSMVESCTSDESWTRTVNLCIVLPPAVLLKKSMRDVAEMAIDHIFEDSFSTAIDICPMDLEGLVDCDDVIYFEIFEPTYNLNQYSKSTYGIEPCGAYHFYAKHFIEFLRKQNPALIANIDEQRNLK